MAYNYAHAFAERPCLTQEQIKEIAVSAIIEYRYEFPDVVSIEVQFYMESKHVEATGDGGEPRLYSWKQLGFQQ